MPARTRTPAVDPAPETEPDTAPAGVPAPEPAEPADAGGFFRNAGATELTVLGDGVTAVLAPGRITALGRTPTHRNLEAATETDFQAQERADRAAAEAAEATPTSETEA
jgi:hypothetical protein